MTTPSPDRAAIQADLRGLMFVSDGTRGSDKVGRLLAAIPVLLAALAATEAERDAARAQAWDECAREVHGLGWLHDWALSDALARNAHRAALDSVATPEAGRHG